MSNTQFAIKCNKWMSDCTLARRRDQDERPDLQDGLTHAWFADHLDDAKLYKSIYHATKARDELIATGWPNAKIVPIEITRAVQYT